MLFKERRKKAQDSGSKNPVSTNHQPLLALPLLLLSFPLLILFEHWLFDKPKGGGRRMKHEGWRLEEQDGELKL